MSKIYTQVYMGLIMQAKEKEQRTSFSFNTNIS